MAEQSPLRWHYGPTEADPNPGSMWCYDCGAEVWVFDEGYICRGCGRQDDDEDAPEPGHHHLPPAEVGEDGRYLGRCTCGWRDQLPRSYESGADADTRRHLDEVGAEAEHGEVIDPGAFDHLLPADVPLTLEFGGPRVGTAHVTRDERGLNVSVRMDEGAAALMEGGAFAGAMDTPLRAVSLHGEDPSMPGGSQPQRVRMRLGRDGKWHETDI